MPLFEYYCDHCKQIFEALIFSKEETIHCPHCGGSSVAKQLSTFGVSVANSALPCAGGSCGMSNPPAGCGEGCCPGCRH